MMPFVSHGHEESTRGSLTLQRGKLAGRFWVAGGVDAAHGTLGVRIKAGVLRSNNLSLSGLRISIKFAPY